MSDHPDRIDRPIESYDPAEPLIVPYGDVIAARNALGNLVACMEDHNDPLPEWRREMIRTTLAMAVDVDRDKSDLPSHEAATKYGRELLERLTSYLPGIPGPGPVRTQHPVSSPSRPTATVTGLDGQPLDRDEYAAVLTEQADPTGPAEGDRVRLTYGDGSTVTGEWAYVGGDVEGMALLTDDGPVHHHVTGQVRRDVIRRAERPLLDVLNQQEALTVAALLDELAGVYPGEAMGQLARTMAVRLYDRLGI